MCSTLKELLSEHNIIVDMGQLDEIPSVHSPFHRSQTDLFMYHKQFFKQKIVTGVVATSHADDSQDESDESDVEGLPTNTYVYTVAEGSQSAVTPRRHSSHSKKAVNQLIANMIHFGSQITVRALKEGEVIDQCITYGLGIDYQEKKARFMKLIMDPDNTKKTMGFFHCHLFLMKLLVGS